MYKIPPGGGGGSIASLRSIMVVRCGLKASWCRTIMTDSFSCILFFFRQLHLGLNMCCFINFTTFFLTINVQFGSSVICWRGNVWRKLTYWCHAQESSHTPSCKKKATSWSHWFIVEGLVWCFIKVLKNYLPLQFSSLLLSTRTVILAVQNLI